MGKNNAQQPIPKSSDSYRRHRPATYISPQDRVALQAGKPTSWQPVPAVVTAKHTARVHRLARGKKPQDNNSAMDTHLLAELPPHYCPGNQ